MADRPIFPNSVKYVRERRNLSLESVAKEAGTSASKLAKIEAGEAVPSPRQYDALSAILGVPDYVLASESKPNLDPVVVDLRQAAATPLTISARGLKAYFAKSATAKLIDSIAQSLQINPIWIKPPGISSKNVASFVGYFHKQFNFEPGARVWVSNPHLALRYLRAKIEQYGVYCFLAEAPPGDYRGLFSRLSDRASLILINKKTFKDKARLFTLLHEFAHFLIDLEGASDPLVLNNEAEAACNEFASQFLAPTDQFIKLFLESRARFNSYVRAISFVSDNTLLSYGAVAFRLRSLRLISNEEYRSWYAQNGLSPAYGAEDPVEDKAEDDGNAGGNWAYNVVTDIGFRPLTVLKQALDQGVIDDVHVGRIINARGATQALAFKTAKDRLGELGL